MKQNHTTQRYIIIKQQIEPKKNQGLEMKKIKKKRRNLI